MTTLLLSSSHLSAASDHRRDTICSNNSHVGNSRRHSRNPGLFSLPGGERSYFPEINDDDCSSYPRVQTYTSPLTDIIKELKRKNAVTAATAGPQISFDTPSDPWGSSEQMASGEYLESSWPGNVTDSTGNNVLGNSIPVGSPSRFSSSSISPLPRSSVCICQSSAAAARQRRRQSWDVRYAQRRSSFGYSSPKRISVCDDVGESGEFENNPTSTSTTNEVSLCPGCGKPRGPPSTELDGRHRMSNSTSSVQFAPKQTRVHDWLDSPRIERLEAPRHAEELLRVTPQLRILSPASTDMDVAGNSSSNNILSFLLPHVGLENTNHKNCRHHGQRTLTTSLSSRYHHQNSSGFSSVAATSTDGMDYKSSLERDRANHRAAAELANLLWICAHEMALEDFGVVESETFTAVFKLVHHSDDMNCRMAGLAALDALIDAPSADDEKKAIKFANTLSGGLRSAHGDYEFLSAVSKALGHMATRTANVDFVEAEVSRALEWLRTDRSDRRLAATLALKEFAIHAPTAFYSKTSQSTLGQGGSNEFLDYIFQAVRDQQPIVRACAADALSECLKILMERQHTSLTGLLCQVHFNVMECLKQETNKKIRDAIGKVEASQHGALLVVATMTAQVGAFLLPRYDEICRKVMDLMSHPKALIRLECIRLLPRLARRCPKIFARRYLDQCLDFLLESAAPAQAPRIEGVDLRSSAYSSIGLMVLAMVDSTTGEVIGGANLPTVKIMDDPERTGEALLVELCDTGAVYQRLNQIFELVCAGLKYRSATASRKSSTVHIAAFHCAADLVEALGETARPYIPNLVDDMFEAGLSNDLINCLHAIAECVPEQQSVIEDRLFKEVSLCLAGVQSARDLCGPLHTTQFNKFRQKIVRIAGDLDGSQSTKREERPSSLTEPGMEDMPTIRINMSTNSSTVKSVVLSLQTLGTFGDSFDSLLPILSFLHNVAAPYLTHPSNQVRRAAALTCCSLLVPHGLLRRARVASQSAVIIEDILEMLLRVAVSDLSPVVRLCVVQALDNRYDPFLCQAHHLQTLFLLLQDEVLATRVAGVRLLGRLSSFNPAPILPFMRKFLLQLLIELQCGVDAGRGREEATRLLVVFLKSRPFQRLILPVLPATVGSLPLNGGTPRLASAAMEALGELAKAVGSSLQPWVNEVCPIILKTLQDQSSSSKQRTSLRTLAQIAGSTGYVMQPYIDYPKLLSQATSILPGTKRAPWSLRREVIRTLGVLGALDPDRYFAVVPKAAKAGAVGGAYFVVQDEANVAKDSSEISINDSAWDEMGKTSSVTASRIQGLGRTVSMLAAGNSLPSSSTLTKRSVLPPGSAAFLLTTESDDLPAHLVMYEQYSWVAQPISSLAPARRMTPNDEDFYPTVTIQALMRIFKDPSLAVHHGMVMQAIMFIFKSLGLRSVQFLDTVVPHIMTTIQTCGPSYLRESLLKQVETLSGIVREHLRPYVADIFNVVEHFWSSSHLSTIFSLISEIAVGVPGEFKLFVPRLIHLYLTTLYEIQITEVVTIDLPPSQRGRGLRETERLRLILSSIRGLRRVLGDYLHLLVPALLKLSEFLVPKSSAGLNSGGDWTTDSDLVSLTVLTLQTIAALLACEGVDTTKKSMVLSWGNKKVNSGSLSAKVVHPLMLLLRGKCRANTTIGLQVIETVCVAMHKLGPSTWMKLYDGVVRVAIADWQNHFQSDFHGNSNEKGIDVVNPAQGGLAQYDSAVKDLQASRWQRSYANPYFRETNCTPQRQDSVLVIGVDQPVFIDNAGGTPQFDNASEVFDGAGSNAYNQQLNQSNRLKINQAQLQRAWDVSQCASRDDWDEWMRRLGIELLREAPSPALRASASLAYAYQPLARELFSAAFVCCWEDISEVYRVNLVHALETAFVADISPEILQALLNVCEFMEHDPNGGLPIDIPILADLALRCRSYAKALHYKEREHYNGGNGNCVEALISINRKLDLHEAALGVLKSATARLEERKVVDEVSIGTFNTNGYLRQQAPHDMFYGVVESTENEQESSPMDDYDITVEKERWLAKLGSWTDALEMYEDKLMRNPMDFDAAVGCMRCLSASGEWQRVLELAEDNWPTLTASTSIGHQEFEASAVSQGTVKPDLGSRDQKKALRMCAEAAWRLGRWEDLEKYSSELVHGQGNTAAVTPGSTPKARQGDVSIPRVDYEGAFFSAILHVHRQEWQMAAEAIDAARKAMDGRFTAAIAESYNRAYPSMVTAQTLAELEEIIDFKKIENDFAGGPAHHHPANSPNAKGARERLLSVWRDRLNGCRMDAEVHSSILAVRGIILGPEDEVEATLKLSELSRQAQQFKLAERVLLDPLEKLGADLNGPLFGYGLSEKLGLHSELEHAIQRAPISQVIDELTTSQEVVYLPSYGPAHYQWSQQIVQEAGGIERLTIQHKLYFAFVKHLWLTDRVGDALSRLSRLCDVVDMISHCEATTDNSLRSACWLELGEWKLEGMSAPNKFIPETLQVEVLSAFKRAKLMEGSYKSMHSFALVNFRIAQQMNGAEEGTVWQRSVLPSTPASQRNHVIAAIKSFVTAISLGTKRWSASVQQDMLNFLTCLFKYGEQPAIASLINDCIHSVPIETWLGVLPQLLARIHIKNPSIRSVLHPLLVRLGEKHPQALMYPLSVLLKSPVRERKNAAEVLMNSLRSHSSALVEEALMVSSELIRVAILWLETWHEGLEEASRLYFGEGNIPAMLDLLLPLHEKIEKGAETLKEADFITAFGQDLNKAHEHIKDYMRLMSEGGKSTPTSTYAGATNGYGLSSDQHILHIEEAETALNKTWDIYYKVFRHINKQFPALTKLELSDCSPALSKLRSLELGIPGSYRVDGSYIRIQKFVRNVQVITSKQRPRKITLRGSDGKDYVFLLKGHEDLRQDERVIQLFGLVNALLEGDRQTRKQDLRIQRYAVSPLSHNCGLVGWVPQTATLHALIRDYRHSKRVPLNMEHCEMRKIAPNFEHNTVMQKVEVFTDALKKTTGQGNDLYEILWLKSTNSEEWLERRTKYTRSLAAMSMVGYILGLGDRHPSNLMLDKLSGRVLHIDFGDCFEVAMNRDKFPETVGFRLTRMLIKAMEVAGIEGSYRSTCERTMAILRENRDSLVAMLEAFVYDPLMSWRLVDLSNNGNDSNGGPRTGSNGKLSSALSSSKSIKDEIGVDGDSGVPIEPNNSRRTGRVRPICEDNDEDDDGDGDNEVNNEETMQPKSADVTDESDDCVLVGAISRREPTASIPIRRDHHREVTMSASRARSLQMYSNIQTWAANLGADDRIASVTGGDTSGQMAVSGSIARSRVAERSMRQRELLSLLEGENGAAAEEALNEKALKVICRVQDKLTGTDFSDRAESGEALAVEDQVQRLIVQATTVENLCQLFIGWCAFW